MKTTVYLGLDIGGTNIRIGAFDKQFQLIKLIKIDTPINDYNLGLQKIFTIINQWKKNYEIKFIGIGAPGILNRVTGELLELSNLPDWCHRTIVNDFKLQYPLVNIQIENDANCAALGHFLQHYDHQKIQSYLFFTFSTGIGAGFIYQQNIFSGAHGLALELSNVIIDGKCEKEISNNSILNINAIEEKCGGKGIIRAFQKENILLENTKSAFALYYKNDLVAQKILQRNQQRIAIFLANSIAYLDPEIIAIGGPIALQNKLYFQEIFDLTNNYLLKTMQNRKFEFVNDTSALPGLLGAAFLNIK